MDQHQRTERQRPYSRERGECDGPRTGIHDGYHPLYASIVYSCAGTPRLSKQLIYHYTSEAGFKAIVESKCLWAGDLRAMNDHTELDYAEGLLIRAIERIDRNAATVLVPALRSEIDAVRPRDLFSVSFSRHPEMKSQWVSYAGKDGVCIGFPVEIFEAAARQDPALSLGPVVYDRDAQAAIVDPIARGVIAYGTNVADRQKLAGFLAAKIAPRFAEVAPFLKHPGMFEEQEVRLVARSPGRVLTRMRRGERVRYIEVPYNRYYHDTPSVDCLFEQVYSAPRREGYLERLRDIDRILTRRRVRFSAIHASQVPYEFE